MFPSQYETALPDFPTDLITAGIKRHNDLLNHKILNKAEFETKKLMLQKVAQQRLQDGEEIIFTSTPDMIDTFKKKITTKPNHIFLTINPIKTISYDCLKKSIDKFVNKKYISAYYGCYEIRDAENTGLHTHLLIEYTGLPHNIERAIKTAFKNISDTTNPHCCNIKYVKDEYINSKVSYITGEKKNAKKNGVELSNKWRPDRFYGLKPPVIKE